MTHPFEECNSKCYPLTLYLSNIEEDIVVFLSGNVTVQLPQFPLFLCCMNLQVANFLMILRQTRFLKIQIKYFFILFYTKIFTSVSLDKIMVLLLIGHAFLHSLYWCLFTTGIITFYSKQKANISLEIQTRYKLILRFIICVYISSALS